MKRYKTAGCDVRCSLRPLYISEKSSSNFQNIMEGASKGVQGVR